MKLIELIRQNSWLSIELTLLDIYPEEKKNISGYEEIFSQFVSMPVIETDMIIEIKREIDDFDNEEYIDISGRKKNRPKDQKEQEISYALEFTPWSEWLGMQIDKNSTKNFTELEIISRCLFEMTFVGFDENGIQKELNKINDTVEEYKLLTDEEKKLRTISLEDFKQQMDNLEN
ncbi:MAG: hypothetical protein K8S14_04715 [Actinomycetia bacterium]|nr:hypothetical protein [Actinomycetes bacterium]